MSIHRRHLIDKQHILLKLYFPNLISDIIYQYLTKPKYSSCWMRRRFRRI